MTLKATRLYIATILADLEPLFAHHKLTLVARDLLEIDADVVVTNDDDLPAVSEVLIDHAQREKR